MTSALPATPVPRGQILAAKRLRKAAVFSLLLSLAAPLVCGIAYAIMRESMAFVPDETQIERVVSQSNCEERGDLLRVSAAAVEAVLTDVRRLALVLATLAALPVGLAFYIASTAGRLLRSATP